MSSLTERYAEYEFMDDTPMFSMALGPYSEDASPAVRDDVIYLNMNGRLVRVVDEGLEKVGSLGKVFCTRLMQDMWSGEIFEPQDSNDIYIAATFENELEALALVVRGPPGEEA